MSSIDPILEDVFSQKSTRCVLDNGLTFLFREDYSADVVSVQVWVKTGSIHEGDILGSGLSHYLEHMLFKGTERRTFKQISGDLQAVGANTNAYTTFDRTVYYVDGPIEAFDEAVDVLSDIVFHSLLDPKETERERDVILREIDMGLDSPDHKVMQALFQEAYHVYPYCYPVIGERALYENVTHADLKKYYQERYVPRNTVVGIAGALSFDDAKDAVDKAFGKIPMSCVSNVHIPSEPLQLGSRARRMTGDYNVTRGSMAYKIPGISHMDSPGLDVLAHMMGNGQSSVLWQRLREERQLVHYIDASSWNPGESGLFWISFTCDNGKRKEVEAAVKEEVERFKQEGPDPEMLEKSLTSFTVSEVNARRTMSGQASRMGLNEVVIGDLEYPRFYFEQLNSLDINEVKRIAMDYLRADKLTTVSLEGEPEKPAVKTTIRSGRSLPDFKELSLDNGVRVLLQPVKGFPKVHFKVVCLGGPLYEIDGARGSTSLMASLLTKDTDQRSAYEVSKIIETAGGYLSHFTGNNTFGLGLEVLSRDIPLAVELLGDALLCPTFNESTFAIERDAHMAHIRESLDGVQHYAYMRLRKLFFGDHPYSIDHMGDLESLESMTAASLKSFSSELLTGSNLILSISGDFDSDDIMDQLKPSLEKIPVKDFVVSKKPYSGPPKTGFFEEVMDREQTIVHQAFLDVGIKSKKFHVGELLDEYFSGMSSKLFENVRERQGLAYFVGSGRTVGIDTGMFSFSAGTSLENYPKVIEAIDKELGSVQKGEISEDDIGPCRVRLKAAKRMGMQTIGSRAMQAGLCAAYQQPINDWRNYDSAIDVISVDDLVEFASSFTPDKGVTCVVKSKDDIL